MKAEYSVSVDVFNFPIMLGLMLDYFYLPFESDLYVLYLYVCFMITFSFIFKYDVERLFRMFNSCVDLFLC